MDIAELKQKYIALKAKADAAWESAKPERDALKLALVEFCSIEEEITLLIDGHELVGTCEGCGTPIFTGERCFHTADGVDLCAEHAPNASDALQQMQATLADGDWADIEWESREELEAAIAQIQTAIAANGDYSLAT